VFKGHNIYHTDYDVSIVFLFNIQIKVKSSNIAIYTQKSILTKTIILIKDIVNFVGLLTIS